MTTSDASQGLSAFLAEHPPFDSLDRYGLVTVAEAAQTARFSSGEVVVDAFTAPLAEVFVVLSGEVDLWNHADRVNEPAEERLGVGSLFGFSAMLTGQTVGPRAVAVGAVEVVRIPGSAVLPAFTSPRGARFLAGEVSAVLRRSEGPPGYTRVEDLVVSPPLEVEPGAEVGDVAREMTEQGHGYAAVRRREGGYGLVTDALLRRRVLVEGRPASTPVAEVAEVDPPTVQIDDSAAEALIRMFDAGADYLLVLDRSGRLRGVVAVRDFAVSPTTAGVSLHEQLRRTASVTELEERARRLPEALRDLLGRGLASSRVLAVYSSMLDTTLRRALVLTLERHGLDPDAFTWLSLGSNGRREAVLSSDLDSAAAFDDRYDADEIAAYRVAFAELDAVLSRAGVSGDDHGATASRALFARTNAEWRLAAQQWLAKPAQNQGAIMTSLLVDGRPVHGDPGLPAVTRVFGDLREHPLTMRLLLQESLSHRARLRSVRDVLARRPETFDIKTNALLPIVNVARWAALSVGSAVLPTPERLRAASGSAMLPTGQADTLIEVFEVLQRLRLTTQLEQRERGEAPSDVLSVARLSPLDRSVIAQAVREISAVQRRMDNIAVYVPTEDWTRKVKP